MLYTFSVWLHILTAAVWIGGMGFLVLVIVPVLRRGDSAGLAKLIHQLGLRFRTVGWSAFAILVATGVYNMHVRGLLWGDLLSGSAWQHPTLRALAVKLILFVAVIALSAVHDFRTGPRATAAWQADPDSPDTLRLRSMAARMGRLNALLALAILWLAVLLVRGGL